MNLFIQTGKASMSKLIFHEYQIRQLELNPNMESVDPVYRLGSLLKIKKERVLPKSRGDRFQHDGDWAYGGEVYLGMLAQDLSNL